MQLWFVAIIPKYFNFNTFLKALISYSGCVTLWLVKMLMKLADGPNVYTLHGKGGAG
jgi:hypothetical protein